MEWLTYALMPLGCREKLSHLLNECADQMRGSELGQLAKALPHESLQGVLIATFHVERLVPLSAVAQLKVIDEPVGNEVR